MRLPLIAILLFFIAFPSFGARYVRPANRSRLNRTARASLMVRGRAPLGRTQFARTALRSPRRAHVWQQTWSAPTFGAPTAGDESEGDDPIVRQAAVEALGKYNGTVVVADPANGRILTVVNQKLAYQDGFTPCSTIKVVAAMGTLLENNGSFNRDSKRNNLSLTNAIARSNNPYFAQLGTELGFEKVTRYARMFGLGEKAVYGLDGEHPGTLPLTVPPEGLGMMTSFGSGINLTPLQLAGTISAIANGGTLYWLQYPRTQVEVGNLRPRIKRSINLLPVVDEIKPGMAGAVEFGTARRAQSAEPIFGKTGTCTHSDNQTHLGWFGSFNEVEGRKLVVVVLLTGGRPINGPVASGVAGEVYKNLSRARYYTRAPLSPFTPTAEILSRIPGSD